MFIISFSVIYITIYVWLMHSSIGIDMVQLLKEYFQHELFAEKQN